MFDSKTKSPICGISLSVSLLVGCAASKPEAPSSSAAEAPKAEARVEVVAEPPKSEPAAVVTYAEPSAPKNKERPDWINNEPDEGDNQLSFVGMSRVHATEKNARNDARRDATNVVVQYLGTIAKNKFEELSVSYGLSSEIVDPTESSQKFQKQIAANVARRLKTKIWHMEREKISGRLGYKYFVLAVMPNSAIENSFKKSLDQSIEEQQKEADNSATEKAKKQAEQAIEMFRKMKKEGLMN